MSNRSLIEFNHDYCPTDDDAACLALGRALRDYMRAFDVDALPPGVVQKHRRHHSEPCPIEASKEAVKDIASRANAHVARIAR